MKKTKKNRSRKSRDTSGSVLDAVLQDGFICFLPRRFVKDRVAFSEALRKKYTPATGQMLEDPPGANNPVNPTVRSVQTRRTRFSKNDARRPERILGNPF